MNKNDSDGKNNFFKRKYALKLFFLFYGHIYTHDL